MAMRRPAKLVKRGSIPLYLSIALLLCGFTEVPTKVIDGDTFKIGKEYIRLSDIDAPESSPRRAKCKKELAWAADSTKRLKELLDEGVKAGNLRIEREGRDYYRRTLARVYIGDREINSIMLDEGLARMYHRKARHWCNG